MKNVLINDYLFIGNGTCGTGDLITENTSHALPKVDCGVFLALGNRPSGRLLHFVTTTLEFPSFRSSSPWGNIAPN